MYAACRRYKFPSWGEYLFGCVGRYHWHTYPRRCSCDIWKMKYIWTSVTYVHLWHLKMKYICTSVHLHICDIWKWSSFCRYEKSWKHDTLAPKSVSIQLRTSHSMSARSWHRARRNAGASSSITEVLDALLDDWTKKAKRMEDKEKARNYVFSKSKLAHTLFSL